MPENEEAFQQDKYPDFHFTFAAIFVPCKLNWGRSANGHPRSWAASERCERAKFRRLIVAPTVIIIAIIFISRILPRHAVWTIKTCDDSRRRIQWRMMCIPGHIFRLRAQSVTTLHAGNLRSTGTSWPNHFVFVSYFVGRHMHAAARGGSMTPPKGHLLWWYFKVMKSTRNWAW